MASDPTHEQSAMRCDVCGEAIAAGSGHYRIGEARIHAECLKNIWRPARREP